MAGVKVSNNMHYCSVYSRLVLIFKTHFAVRSLSLYQASFYFLSISLWQISIAVLNQPACIALNTKFYF